MSRNNDYIQETFKIYKEALNTILHADIQKMEPELFAKLIALNNRHLIDNLDKALNIFKDKVEDSK